MDKNRCSWANNHQLLMEYHDQQWGVPVHDDHLLFEMLVLEGAQAGLNWLTILKKRETYQRVFKNFEIEQVARFSESDCERLMEDAGIIRNRLKINSAVVNAQIILKLRSQYGSFDKFIWKFVNHTPIINHFETLSEVPASTAISDAMSKELRKIGFKFVGSTICYSFMEAIGMVNDHLNSCFRKNLL